jgi:hypothetical protein
VTDGDPSVSECGYSVSQHPNFQLLTQSTANLSPSTCLAMLVFNRSVEDKTGESCCDVPEVTDG